MNITALLSFYDEQPEMLSDLVESLAAAGVSGIVAVDGAYAEYPGATNTTGTDQAETIVDVATRAGMKVVVYVPDGPWEGNELEKREFLFALGHKHVEVGVDWFWVVDGDEIVIDAGQLHETLAETDLHVAECALHERGGRVDKLRMLFRSQSSGIRLGKYHAHYVTGDGRVLWASCHRNYEDPAVYVPMCHVLHRPLDRPKERLKRRRQYYERAVLLGIDEAVI